LVTQGFASRVLPSRVSPASEVSPLVLQAKSTREARRQRVRVIGARCHVVFEVSTHAVEKRL